MDALDKLHTEALARFENAQEFERENRLLAEEDFQFLAGDGQWPYEVRTQRERDGRPCLTMNRLPAFVSQVVNDARQNKPAIKINPVDDNADIDTADVIEGLIRHIEADSDADVAYISGLQQACEGGFGHWRVLTDYHDELSFDQDIKVERIQNPFSVYWDHNARDVSKRDAEWCFVTEWMSTEAFDRRYPKAKDEVRDWEADITLSRYGGWLENNKKVRVAEYWCKKREKVTISMMPDGQVFEGDVEGAEKTRETFAIKVIRYVLSGDKVLQGPEEWPGKHIPIVSVFGPEEFIDGRCRYRSIARHAKDAQRMYNYWQTSITEKIALAPKVPFIGTVENFKGLERFWQGANTDNKAFLPYNPDPKAPGAAPQRQPGAEVNVAEITQANQSIEDIKAAMGMFDASIGAKSNETSGKAILARQREGDTATFGWVDNLARAIEHTGRILVDLIPKIYDTQRAIRILGEDDSVKTVTVNELQVDPFTMTWQKINDLSVGRYDVRVSVGPSYATKRVEAAESMMAFIQAFPAAAPITGDLIAKAMDWPGAEDIAARLKKALPPEFQEEEEEMTPEEIQQRQQAQMAQQQREEEQYNIAKAKEVAEIENKQADTQVKMADVRVKMVNAAKAAEEAEAQGIENDMVVSGLDKVMKQLGGVGG